MRKERNFIILLLVAQLCLPFVLFAQPGSLVTSFGDQGSIIIDFEDRNDRFNNLAVGRNGEIVAAGDSRIGGNFSPSDFVVAKFDHSGHLIDRFGENGILRGSLADSASHIIEAMVLDENDNIYVGLSLAIQDSFQVYVLRIDRNGNLDTSYADKGIYIVEDGPGFYAIYQLLVDKEGRLIVVAGNAVDVTITRLSDTGRKDSTYAEEGTMYLKDPTSIIRIWDIALLPDGKLLGTGQSFSQNMFSKTMIRVTQNGQLDSTYGGTGIVLNSLFEFSCRPTDMIILNDDKVLVTGFVYNGSYNETFFMKYKANGQLDSSFGSNGLSIISIDRGLEIYGIHVLSDLSILGVGGKAMIKLNSRGKPDSTWGEGGVLQIMDEYILAMKFVSEDDFLVAGSLQRAFYLGKYTTKDLSTAIRNQTSLEADIKVLENPFTGSVRVLYKVNRDEKVSLDLYDLMGRKVQTLLSPVHRSHGSHYDEFIVDASISQGPYLLRFSYGNYDQIIKVIKQ